MTVSTESQRIQTSLLPDRPGDIPVLARWYYDEWGEEFGRSIAGLSNQLRNHHCNRDTIPITVVATADGIAVGAASIVRNDMDIFTELVPWVNGVYVDAGHRRKGVGGVLMRALEREARRLDYDRLYLYTHSAGNRAFYGSLGWRPIHEVDYHGKSVVVMERGLTENGGGAM